MIGYNSKLVKIFSSLKIFKIIWIIIVLIILNFEETIENIKKGNSNIRNPILASFATKILPYRGLGSGIRRALKVYPHIEFVDDREGNLLIAIIKRKMA